MKTFPSKAAEKRYREAKSKIENKLEKELVDFKNNYMDSYSSWNISKIQRIADRYPQVQDITRQKLISNEFFPLFQGQTCTEAGMNDMTCYRYRQERPDPSTVLVTPSTVNRAITKMANARLTISRMAILQHEFLAEAFESYNIKLARFVDRVLASNISETYFKIDMVSNAGGELEFMIHNTQIQLHARFIFAQGEINAPHYRFIITEKKVEEIITDAQLAQKKAINATAPKKGSRTQQVKDLMDQGIINPKIIAQKLDINPSYLQRIMKTILN